MPEVKVERCIFKSVNKSGEIRHYIVKTTRRGKTRYGTFQTLKEARFFEKNLPLPGKIQRYTKSDSLVGDVYGKLKVLRVATRNEKGPKEGRYWMCECECGRRDVMKGPGALDDKSSCNEDLCHKDAKDYTGEENDYFKVISRTEIRSKQSYWIMLCKECGFEEELPIGRFLNSKSCGCTHPLAKEPIIAAATKRYKSLKKRAAKKEWKFDLTVEQIAKVLVKPCTYCGGMDVTKVPRKIPIKVEFNSADRFDNSKGYIFSNLQATCKQCNLVKKTKSDEGMRAWIKRLSLSSLLNDN